MTRRGLVIGGGGTLGLAWAVGALSALEEALDWDPRSASVIVGTGSGAEVAAVLGAGFPVRDMVRALSGHPGAPRVLAEHFAAERRLLPPPPLPAPSSIGLAIAGLRRRVPAQSAISGLMPVGTASFSRVVDFGRLLANISSGSPAGWVSHPETWLIAAERRTGRRVPFGFRGAPAADLGVALAAASARPGWYPPLRVHDRAYVDASVASPTSADMLLPLGLDEVVIVAPTTSRDAGFGWGLTMLERIFRRGTTMRLDLEEAVLQADGTRVVRIEPGPQDLAAMGVNPMDYRRRMDVVVTSLQTSRERVAAAVARSGAGLLTPSLDRPAPTGPAAVRRAPTRLALSAAASNDGPMKDWPADEWPTDETPAAKVTWWQRLRPRFGLARRAA